MRLNFTHLLAATSVSALLLTACGGGGSGSSSTTPTASVNTAPIVNAGLDQTVTKNSTVQLNATVTDAENDATLTWSQISGPTVTLSSTSDEDPSFIAPDVTATQSIVLRLTADDGVNTAAFDDVSITVNETSTATGEWIVNTTNEKSNFIMDGAAFVEVNVQSVTQSGDVITVQTNTIPNYTVTITQEALDVYETKASSSFASGSGALALGNIVEFGEDVGYVSECASGGDGWWPSAGGGGCPVAQELNLSFPATPSPTTTECETSIGPVGLWVNGVPLYNWSDGVSYNNQGAWNQYAFPLRAGGMDLCYGHSSGRAKQYHHHNYNACLRQLVEDAADGHSPVYGYAGDGYPVHGPYHAAGEPAQSCWKMRDYSASSATGCGTEGARTCTFIDEENISLGTQTVLPGPDADGSGDLTSNNGVYYEDFYYDATCTTQGDKYLDEHNGHDHDDLGYHYHATTDEDLIPTFPLVNGPDYYGDVSGGSFTCYSQTF